MIDILRRSIYNRNLTLEQAHIDSFFTGVCMHPKYVTIEIRISTIFIFTIKTVN